MQITIENSLDVLARHMLRDGMNLLLDFEGSHGNYLRDLRSGREYLDFFSFFASLPIGFNHPGTKDPTYQAKLNRVAQLKPSNADVYSLEMAEFVGSFARLAGHEHFRRYFFISGGALAVENALKAAFDWKVRKNLAAGKGELGTQVIHFKEAFHGRSGYTMSLTNTDPLKTMYFPKFNWPRINNPKCQFPLDQAAEQTVAATEAQALSDIQAAIAANPDDIAALIIEPIQSEGGDNHFRPEFLKALRQICNEQEIILIFDEVQTGIGITGKMWAFEHFPDAMPDIVCFGKKTQVCGMMASERLNEVDSVFKVSSRINSTFGGNLVDMVRCQRYLEIIHEQQLVENAATVGAFLLDGLQQLQQHHDSISNVRGRGLMLAFDCPDAEFRKRLCDAMYDQQMIGLVCGEKSMRFRPGLAMTREDAAKGLEILDSCLKKV
ncbi:MAG: L-lysine 6-transaminase [Candidatus Melainabacteria bacterium HGW-Melainabacteria-1]|nr:MAG: L-lysine 6-transaminase [Candidatus Melainabacteria bacterium HGW-Melainabacteria-1]